MMATKIEIKQDYRYSVRSQQTLILLIILILSLSIFILMSLCLMSSYWITAEGFRQGLLYLCIEESTPQDRSRYEPLPFGLNRDELEPGCYPNRDKGYIKLCVFFCLITLIFTIATSCLTGLSMRLRGSKRAGCLRYAICTTLVTLLCDTCLLIVYPTQFAKELDKSNRDLWELNWAFGTLIGAEIITLAVLILLVAALRKITNIYEAAPTRI